MRWILPAALIILVGIEHSAATSQPLRAHSKCPAECPEQCEEDEVRDCKETAIDECGCCPVCLRARGESCGREGVCEQPLQCAAASPLNGTALSTQSSFVCLPPPAEMESVCAHTPCPIPFHPRCPPDSSLRLSPPPPSQCCSPPGVCQCDMQKCEVPECADGPGDRVLKEAARGEPGACCDQYVCQKKDPVHCRQPCPPLILSEDDSLSSHYDECPVDSYRPPVHREAGACCPVQPGCRCLPSACRPAVCPDGQRVKLLSRGNGAPGSCCDDWTCEEEFPKMVKGCSDGGGRYRDGEEWHRSSCEICRCKRGVAACLKQSCQKPPAQCTWIAIPAGECCPVCFGCQTEKQEKKRMSETWQPDDCTTCTCSSNGASVCEKHLCRAECENPKKVEGQCCPVCDAPTILTLPSTCPSLEHCPLRCENGLRRDDRGCFLCDCLPPVVPPPSTQCNALDEHNCEKQCAHGYLRDRAGCAVCRCAKCPPLHQCIKHCLYGFETNSVGCPVCKCRAMARIDARLSIADKLGKIAGKDRCVSLSPSGRVLERDGGEWWNDGCRHCFCEQKQEFCSLISCPERPVGCPSDNWQQTDDSCCPSCTVPLNISSLVSAAPSKVGTTSALSAKHEHTVCQSPGTGRLFTDGETWQLAPCVSCTCRVGHVLCRVAGCPPTPCEHPLPDPANQCCPRCPVVQSEDEDTRACMDDAGVARQHSAIWRTDDCTSCKCTNGATECYRERCGELKGCKGVPLVLKGRCCPVCSDVLSTDAVCTYDNTVYSVKEEWRDGDCRNCSCVAGGQTVCRELVCPDCAGSVPVPGQCCPLCRDSGWAPFGEGNGSSVLLSPSSRSDSSPSFSTLSLLGCSFAGLLLFALIMALVFIMYKRSKSSHKKASQLSKVQSAVHLSAARRMDSVPQLFDPIQHYATRRDSGGAQSESLLSTDTEYCGSSGASSSSSGHGTLQSAADDHTVPPTVSLNEAGPPPPCFSHSPRSAFQQPLLELDEQHTHI